MIRKRRPIIGLNTSLSGGGVEVPYSYVEAVISAGGIPLLIPPSADLDAIREISSRVDGFIFIGGRDYSPKHYGGHPQPEEELIHPLRDCFDFALAHYVLEKTEIPVLGICGGMQLMTIARGGKLIQDIRNEWSIQQDKAVNHKEGRHEVKILAHTYLAELLASGEGLTLVTNTSHHQAVQPQAPGRGFKPCAYSLDGIVEAIEPDAASSWAREKRFVIGVQWHPEQMISDLYQLSLFYHLIEAAQKWRWGKA